jgi:hypothetical protein
MRVRECEEAEKQRYEAMLRETRGGKALAFSDGLAIFRVTDFTRVEFVRKATSFNGQLSNTRLDRCRTA